MTKALEGIRIFGYDSCSVRTDLYAATRMVRC
ncbi:MAG: hypothetical protein CM1200mP30_31730 [Pseudomonadota bacterium]|nr:MAG: hypothetical protein CM1200mP30_31730 [Pseudomonadota bacterium]